jgi:hypothetical protein
MMTQFSKLQFHVKISSSHAILLLIRQGVTHGTVLSSDFLYVERQAVHLFVLRATTTIKHSGKLTKMHYRLSRRRLLKYRQVREVVTKKMKVWNFSKGKGGVKPQTKLS